MVRGLFFCYFSGMPYQRQDTSRVGAQRLRGTIQQLRKQLGEARDELVLLRRVLRAARRYITSGRDDQLRRVMSECGFEEPIRRPAKQAEGDPPEPECDGTGFVPYEEFEVL